MVKIGPGGRKFSRFKFRGQIFEFQCLPFGLCTSPYVFTKLLKPVLNFLRERGWLSTAYIDDTLCIGKSRAVCKKNVAVRRKTLTELGFIINEEKSKDEPDYKSCPGVPYGMLYTKMLEREKMKALILNDQNFDRRMIIHSYVKKDLEWWLKNIPVAKNPIRSLNYRLEIFSDASLRGWGAHCNGENTHGFWSQEEKRLHINQLEIIAAFLALKCFAREVQNCEILLRIDNTTAISYINRMGGVQYVELNQRAKDIWTWCEKRRIWIFASYIPSRENTDADRESRRVNVDTEWELGAPFFQTIVERWGFPEIDLFASRSNAKTEVFCSWKRDPEARYIDAFTVNWSKYLFYAFPPFAMVAKVLQKINSDKAQGIVVVPHWPTQPWFPLFKSMLLEEPLYFSPSPKLLLSPCRSLIHPLADHLSLVAGRLSGDRINRN